MAIELNFKLDDLSEIAKTIVNNACSKTLIVLWRNGRGKNNSY